MARIVVNMPNAFNDDVYDKHDAAEALREIADRIDEGYTNGIVGWSDDTWSIEED